LCGYVIFEIVPNNVQLASNVKYFPKYFMSHNILCDILATTSIGLSASTEASVWLVKLCI